MEAIILAGGLGTRLKTVVADVPKPMALVQGRPFLEYILKYLIKNKINKIILSVGYKWETIRDYFAEEYRGIPLLYSVENQPLGTGGAINKALAIVDGEKVFIINGDTFFDVPLDSLRLENDRKIVLSLKSMQNFERYGSVETDADGNVTSFREKKYIQSGYINGGIYLLNKNIFHGYNLEEKFSFEEFIQENLAELKITSEVFGNYFIDIGIPEDYQRAQTEMLEYD